MECRGELRRGGDCDGVVLHCIAIVVVVRGGDGGRWRPCAREGVRRGSRSFEGLWREATIPVAEGGALARVGGVRVASAPMRHGAGRLRRPLKDTEKSSAIRLWYGGTGLGGLGDRSRRATTVDRAAAAFAATTPSMTPRPVATRAWWCRRRPGVGLGSTRPNSVHSFPDGLFGSGAW